MDVWNLQWNWPWQIGFYFTPPYGHGWRDLLKPSKKHLKCLWHTAIFHFLLPASLIAFCLIFSSDVCDFWFFLIFQVRSYTSPVLIWFSHFSFANLISYHSLNLLQTCSVFLLSKQHSSLSPPSTLKLWCLRSAGHWICASSMVRMVLPHHTAPLHLWAEIHTSNVLPFYPHYAHWVYGPSSALFYSLLRINAAFLQNPDHPDVWQTLLHLPAIFS